MGAGLRPGVALGVQQHVGPTWSPAAVRWRGGRRCAAPSMWGPTRLHPSLLGRGSAICPHGDPFGQPPVLRLPPLPPVGGLLCRVPVPLRGAAVGSTNPTGPPCPVPTPGVSQLHGDPPGGRCPGATSPMAPMCSRPRAFPLHFPTALTQPLPLLGWGQGWGRHISMTATGRSGVVAEPCAHPTALSCSSTPTQCCSPPPLLLSSPIPASSSSPQGTCSPTRGSAPWGAVGWGCSTTPMGRKPLSAREEEE